MKSYSISEIAENEYLGLGYALVIEKNGEIVKIVYVHSYLDIDYTKEITDGDIISIIHHPKTHKKVEELSLIANGGAVRFGLLSARIFYEQPQIVVAPSTNTLH